GEGVDDFFEARIAAERVPDREQFQGAVAQQKRRGGSTQSSFQLLQGKLLVACPRRRDGEILKDAARCTLPSTTCATPNSSPILRRLRASPLLCCITEVRLMTFKSAIFAKVGQNLVLHAVSEIAVLLIATQIFKRQY